METPGKGGVLARKGSENTRQRQQLAANAVETPGKGGVFTDTEDPIQRNRAALGPLHLRLAPPTESPRIGYSIVRNTEGDVLMC